MIPSKTLLENLIIMDLPKKNWKLSQKLKKRGNDWRLNDSRKKRKHVLPGRKENWKKENKQG
ncbi:hypothetical protein D3C80_1952780 [compost metagenome]